MTGWRWESYQTVEVQVPDDWRYGTTDRPPCLVNILEPPYVGRPGAVRGIGCRDPFPPVPYRTSYLWFDADWSKRNRPMPDVPGFRGAREPGVQPADHGWTEETRVVDGVYLTVLSDDDALRQRILDSARPIDGIDANGCSPDHPFAHDPGGRPTGDLATLGPVDTITVGRYSLGGRSLRAHAPLIASSTLTGDVAKALVAAIGAAPEGLDPDVPGCLIVYGGELIVLTIHAGDRTQEVLVRYAGCRFNGTDDGTTQRRLTAAVVRPLLTGVHQQTSYNNGLYELVTGHAGGFKPTGQ